MVFERFQPLSVAPSCSVSTLEGTCLSGTLFWRRHVGEGAVRLGSSPTLSSPHGLCDPLAVSVVEAGVTALRNLAFLSEVQVVALLSWDDECPLAGEQDADAEMIGQLPH